jgi:hypothetical protein
MSNACLRLVEQIFMFGEYHLRLVLPPGPTKILHTIPKIRQISHCVRRRKSPEGKNNVGKYMCHFLELLRNFPSGITCCHIHSEIIPSFWIAYLPLFICPGTCPYFYVHMPYCLTLQSFYYLSLYTYCYLPLHLPYCLSLQMSCCLYLCPTALYTCLLPLHMTYCPLHVSTASTYVPLPSTHVYCLYLCPTALYTCLLPLHMSYCPLHVSTASTYVLLPGTTYFPVAGTTHWFFQLYLHVSTACLCTGPTAYLHACLPIGICVTACLYTLL